MMTQSSTTLPCIELPTRPSTSSPGYTRRSALTIPLMTTKEKTDATKKSNPSLESSKRFLKYSPNVKKQSTTEDAEAREEKWQRWKARQAQEEIVRKRQRAEIYAINLLMREQHELKFQHFVATQKGDSSSSPEEAQATIENPPAPRACLSV